MAKHIFITNSEGGYFYRIYPKLARLRFGPDNEKSVQRNLFNPLPVFDTHFTLNDLYGRFIHKYHDKEPTIELLQKADYAITCLLTGAQERRTLQSKIIIIVPLALFRYPFEKDKIYSLSTNEVKDITP